MLRYKAILTAVILAALLFTSLVNSSDAIKIIDFPSDTEDTSYNGWTYHGAYVKTDVPIYHVSWSIDGKWAYGETLDSTTKYASYHPYDKIPGKIKGKKYEIEVEVWEWDADDEVFRSTTASYTVRMFESIFLYGVGERTGAWGYTEISRFYYDGTHIIMDSYTYASNPRNNPKAKKPDDNPLTVAPWFRTNEYTAPDGSEVFPEHRNTKPLEIIQVGETSQYYTPGPYIDKENEEDEDEPFERWVGTLEEGDDPLYFGAHTHLQVWGTRTAADNWEVDTKQQTGTTAVTFTWEDGP